MKSGTGYVVTTIGDLVAQAIDATKEMSDGYTNHQTCSAASLVVSHVLAENGHEVLLRRLASLGLETEQLLSAPQLRRGPQRKQPAATHGSGSHSESARVVQASIAS